MSKTIQALLCIVIVIFFNVSPARADKKIQHAPFAEKSCDSCHSSAKPGKQDLVATAPELCYGCHDRFAGKFMHSPTSVGACLVCHNPHEAGGKGLLRMATSDLCYQCHSELEGQIHTKGNNVHPPAEDNCTACHNPHVSDISDKMLQAPMQKLCVDCHQEQGVEPPADFASVKNKHQPVTDARSCTNCHSPHGSPLAAYLLSQPMDLCLKCHSEQLTNNEGQPVANIGKILKENKDHHGPIGEKNCSGCHNPHGSDFPRLLVNTYPPEFYTRGYSREDYRLCFTCHDAAAMETRETTTLTNFRNGKKNLHYIHVNRQTKGRTCRACHETHASNQPKHIRASVPFGKINWPLELQYRLEYTDFKTGQPCDTPSITCKQSGGSCVACHARKTYNYLKQ